MIHPEKLNAFLTLVSINSR